LIASIIFFLLWFLASKDSKLLIPDPLVVIKETYKLFRSEEFYFSLFFTMKRMLIGFSISVVASILISLLMERYKLIKMFFETYVNAALLIPAVIFVYIIVIIYGVKEVTPILIIVFITAPELIIILSTSLENLNKDYTQVARVYKINKITYLFKIIFPQIIPNFFAALKIEFSVAWKMAIIAEAFALSNGIGYAIYYQFQLFSLKGVISWTIAFMIIMTILQYGLINFIEKKLLKWKTYNNYGIN
jgi:NitT/TauT family transport system permease protein